MPDRRWFAWSLLAAMWSGSSCGDTFVRIPWTGEQSVTIPGFVIPDIPDTGWTPSESDLEAFDTDMLQGIEGLLDEELPEMYGLDAEFDDAAVDIDAVLQDIHLLPGDLSDVYLRSLRLSVEGPGDLGFLARVTVWFEHAGGRSLLASRYSVAPGVKELDLFVEEVELSREILAGSTRMVVGINGLPPRRDIQLKISFTLSFGVTRQGACSACRVFGG